MFSTSSNNITTHKTRLILFSFGTCRKRIGLIVLASWHLDLAEEVCLAGLGALQFDLGERRRERPRRALAGFVFDLLAGC